MSNPGEKWAELLEQAPCGLLELDSDYAIRLANGYLSNLLGRTFAELQGQKFYNLLTVPGRILVQTWVWPKLDLAGQVEELALDFVRADGERIPVLLNASQPHDAQGRPGYIRMAITRAAAKRAYEAEVPKARQAAASASRVKGDFLANVSHEIRTPLNGMLGVAGALAQTELAPAQREMVELIQSSGAMLERLLADILDVSKVDAGGLEVETRPLELRRELDGVLGLARSRAVEKGLLFTALYGPATEGWFNGDATRLKQVLGNLTSNALKFTEAGEVCVEVDIEGSGPDCELVLTVEDTGIGFDDTQSDVLFKRFQQADGGITRRYGGTGWG
jgi:PAS domain S-box-containing protein